MQEHEEQTSAEVFKVIDLNKKFVNQSTGEPLEVIAGVSLSVSEGEFVAVVGPSGCGKTTLLRLLAGMMGVTSGEIRCVAEESQIGFVFQDASLLPWRTVSENIALPLELRVRAQQASWQRPDPEYITSLVELVNLNGFESYYPYALSGGMQQRVNLARALAIRPKILLMDEPFSALDAQTREELQVELQRIAIETQATIVFITHDIREAVYLADRVLVLSSRPSGILEAIRIEEPRPRPIEFQVSETYVELLRKVWSLVHKA